MTFRLALSLDLALLRVRADAREALPDFFYRGPSAFDGQPVGNAGGVATDSVSASTAAAGGTVLAFNSLGSGTGSATAQLRSVTESDIWTRTLK